LKNLNYIVFGLRGTGYGLRVAWYGLRVTGCVVRVTWYGFIIWN